MRISDWSSDVCSSDLLLETGPGGIADTTNVIPRPRLTAITPIGIDHVAFLGDTIARIAVSKAGIIKPGVPCVVGPQPEEAMAVIAAQAEDCGAPMFRYGVDGQVETMPDGKNGRGSGRERVV